MRDYSIICPDGWVFEFDSHYWSVDMGPLDGMGLPPVEHVTQKQFKQAGELLQDIHIGARLVTITGGINGDCLEELHSLRKRLFSALRWNRTNDDPPLPSQLRYRLNNRAAYLNCYYAGDVIANVGTDEKQQTIGIKLIAYDPMWYDSTEKTGALTLASTPDVHNCVGKFAGAWSAMGAAGTGDVDAIVFSPDGTKVYVGGVFLNWAGIANADYVACYDIATGTWSALAAGPGFNVAAMAIAPNGDLYVAGNVILQGFVAYWNGAAWTTIAAGATTNNMVRALAFGPDGTLYAGGLFTNINGVAANRVAKWNGAIWAALGTGMDAQVNALVCTPNGKLYAGGAFTTAGGGAAAQIAYWDTAWHALGDGTASGGTMVWALAVDAAGTLYAAGTFTALGGATLARIGKWNGYIWLPLSTGLNSDGQSLAVDSQGNLYAGGIFTTAGGLAIADRVAMWNGSVWSQLEVDLPGTPRVYAIACFETDLALGFDTDGASVIPGQTNVTMSGDVEVYPIITVTGPGTLQWIENAETGERIIFNCYINAGETITIDLSPGIKTIVSDWRGDMFPYAPLVPLSDFGSFALEPDPIAPLGVNTINVMMTGTTGASLGSIKWTDAFLSVDAKVGA